MGRAAEVSDEYVALPPEFRLQRDKLHFDKKAAELKEEEVKGLDRLAQLKQTLANSKSGPFSNLRRALIAQDIKLLRRDPAWLTKRQAGVADWLAATEDTAHIRWQPFIWSTLR